MTIKTHLYASMAQYDAYHAGRETEYNVVDIIETDTHWLADLMTECKTAKTALRRFFRGVEGIKALADYAPCMDEQTPAQLWATYWDDEQGRSVATGDWAYGLEQLDDNLWYVYLNTRKPA